MATWESEEALLLEKERRSDERLRKAEVKRKAVSGAKPMYAPSKRKSVTTASAPKGAVELGVPHSHNFLADEEFCAETDIWTKRCACGFSVEYERM